MDGGRAVAKRATFIPGFDAVTSGGLPAGRLTAIIGQAGAGKTVFAFQTLVNRLRHAGEAGIFVAFEEPVHQIRANMAAFDWELGALDPEKLRFIDARLPVDATLSGAFDLAGLLAGLDAMRAETGAGNIVFDGIDMLLCGLRDERLERAELVRLNDWIGRTGISAMLTVKAFGPGERDQRRADFLQYITDCAVVLGETVAATATSRTLRVTKFRGSPFNANTMPCVMDRTGLNVVVFKGDRLDYPDFGGRISSGVPRLDALLSGGYLAGSSILVSGAPGTAKSSLACAFTHATCAQGGLVLFISFDESATQIVSNMRSIGIDLRQHIESGRLAIESLLSSGQNPEAYFIRIRKLLERQLPAALVIDPISALQKTQYPFSQMISECLLDLAKSLGVTVFCTSLLDHASGAVEFSASQVSTVADTWLHLSYVAHEGERNRALTIVKARGTDHSNQVRELVLSAAGIGLVDVYTAEGAVLMGSARAQKEAEIARLDVEEDLQVRRNRLRLQRELEQLREKLRVAKLELNWKEQEADMLRLADAERVEARRLALRERRGLRRSDTEAAHEDGSRVPL